jgi:HPt (histidine-containing phosphotransfer) domain-containing protein
VTAATAEGHLPMQDQALDDDPVWDPAGALASVGGNEALARALLRRFCAALPADLARLRQAHAAGDLAATTAQAHHINGGAAYCGVPALRRRLAALETSARAGDAAGAGRALADVETAADRLIARVRTLP